MPAPVNPSVGKTKILLTGNPKGNFHSCFLSGVLKPGMAVSIKLGTAPKGGLLTYEAFNPSADGDPRILAVLLENEESGVGPTTAYASGDVAKVYYPIPGDEMNLLLAGQTGTGSLNVVTIGERLNATRLTGKWAIQSTSANRAPAQVIENFSEPTNVDSLVACIMGGSL